MIKFNQSIQKTFVFFCGMNKKSFNQSMKQGLMIIAFCFALSHLNAQTFRIQEHSVNPNCGGTYSIFGNGITLVSGVSFNYNPVSPPSPPNFNKLFPTAPSFFTGTPDSIVFSISSCTGTTFSVAVNQLGTVMSCDCLNLGFAQHTFSATWQTDPSPDFDYILNIYY